MRRTSVLACTGVLLAALLATHSAHATIGFAVGDTAAALVAPDASGTPRTLSEFAGRWVFLDFCCRWCSPCRAMGLSTQAVQDAFDNDPNAPPFQYVTGLFQNGYGVASTAGDAAAWASTYGITHVPVLHADGAAASALEQWFAGVGSGAVPTGAVIDPDGVIRAIDVGYRDPEQLLKQVFDLAGIVLPPPPPPPPPPATPAQLSNGFFEIGTPTSHIGSPLTQIVNDSNLQFFDFGGTLPGLDFPYGGTSSTVSDGVEAIDVGVINVDTQSFTFVDIDLDTPWKPGLKQMAWSDGLGRVRADAGPVMLTLEYFDGAWISEFPTSIVVPDTFDVNEARFGSVTLRNVPNRPAHVVGFLLQGLRVKVDTTAGSLATTAVPPARAPHALDLAAPTPNPARAFATFAWTQPRAGESRLEVLDVTGRAVRRLAVGAFAAGAHERRWDLRDAAGRRVAPGVYFARLTAGGATSVRRVAVLE